MNRIERIVTVMKGEIPDRIPVMTHNFMMAAREAGVTMEEFRNSPKVLADALIAACVKYGTDGILLDVDTALLASACGAEVMYPKDIPAVTKDRQSRSIDRILGDLPAVDLMKSERIQKYLEAIHLLSDWCRENGVFLRANADQGPFSLACLLVGMNEFLMDLLDEDLEEDLQKLIRETMRISLEMHRLCFEAGGHCTSYGNSSEGCSVVSPDVFRKFGKPSEIELNKKLREEGIPTICHICGWADPILEDLAETGCPMFEFDARTDIRKAREAGRGHYVLSGNLDPAMLASGTPDQVKAATMELLDLFRGKGGLMIGPGCALAPDTPGENIRAIVETTKQFG